MGMRSFRSKPVGWQHDNYRHYLAAKYGFAGRKQLLEKIEERGAIEKKDFLAGKKRELMRDKGLSEKVAGERAEESWNDLVADESEKMRRYSEKMRRYNVSKESSVTKRGVKFMRYDIEDPEMAAKQIEFMKEGKGNRVVVTDEKQGWTARTHKGYAEEPEGEGLANLYGRAESEKARRLLNKARFEEALVKKREMERKGKMDRARSAGKYYSAEDTVQGMFGRMDMDMLRQQQIIDEKKRVIAEQQRAEAEREKAEHQFEEGRMTGPSVMVIPVREKGEVKEKGEIKAVQAFPTGRGDELWSPELKKRFSESSVKVVSRKPSFWTDPLPPEFKVGLPRFKRKEVQKRLPSMIEITDEGR